MPLRTCCEHSTDLKRKLGQRSAIISTYHLISFKPQFIKLLLVVKASNEVIVSLDIVVPKCQAYLWWFMKAQTLGAIAAIPAEESLSIYCKPVELYNILQRRALRNPLFQQRCLDYKIQAKHKRRIKITISLSAALNNGEQVQKMFPLYVLLVRHIPCIATEEQSSIYRLSRACIVSAFCEDGRKDHTEATFILPELKKLLVDGKPSSLCILFLSYGELRSIPDEQDFLKDQDIGSFRSKLEGSCLWGRLQMELLYSSWVNSASFSLGNRAETLLNVDMHTSFLKPAGLNESNCIMFQGPLTSGSILKRVQVNVFAQEIGAVERSPYDSYTFDDVPSSSVAHLLRLRAGNVIFNYRYYNNTLQKTEVTEEFSCAFCLVRCGSFKGLRFHLTCSHDLFSFEFWVTEEYQAVNVSVKTDIWRAEIVADGVDPRLQTFCYGSKPRKRRRLKNIVQDVKHVCPPIMKLDSPVEAREGSQEGSLENEAGASSPHMLLLTHSKDAEPSNEFSLRRCEADGKGDKMPKAILSEAHPHSEKHNSETQNQQCPEPVTSNSVPGACAAIAVVSTGTDSAHPASGSNIVTPTFLQFAKTRKISAERGDPRNRTLLQKRQFFHSHRAQPMALDQVLSDRDSEDEVDDDIADFEDRRMLDDFVDVTKDEKQIMHLWNSFVRKQRVLADGHIPWACEAFSKLHGPVLVQQPALIWCWRLFMIKLWNHSLLDARTMNNFATQLKLKMALSFLKGHFGFDEIRVLVGCFTWSSAVSCQDHTPMSCICPIDSTGMLKQVERLRFVDLAEPRYPSSAAAGKPSEDLSKAPPTAKAWESDEFRMYAFKIKRCPKNRAHDWTQCPYAHRGEKARRRDPSKFHYTGIACPDFRHGSSCPRGDSCEFAHGVFEFWLHPARYRTRACKAGRYCQRKVCFFAHTPEQLRSGTKYVCHCAAAAAAMPPTSAPPDADNAGAGTEQQQLCWDFLDAALGGMRIGDDAHHRHAINFGGDTSDTPDIDWVWELLN
ncbi:hypothetical protein H6P81_005069 [Aristolochia fimbriata]|uniref:C3H1-type domain-containing protein n=2 Tax=Magnoliopsida TaxID=3398 RepID=A0AAV7ETF2_ARIFI|nr:hypothetical protein H6P81_005069 [Aristolochia fimbriata]